MYFSDRLDYIQKDNYSELKQGYRILGKILWRFYEKVKSN